MKKARQMKTEARAGEGECGANLYNRGVCFSVQYKSGHCSLGALAGGAVARFVQEAVRLLRLGVELLQCFVQAGVRWEVNAEGTMKGRAGHGQVSGGEGMCRRAGTRLITGLDDGACDGRRSPDKQVADEHPCACGPSTRQETCGVSVAGQADR